MNESLTPVIGDALPPPHKPHAPALALPTMTPDQRLHWLSEFTAALAQADDASFGVCLKQFLIPAIADLYALELLLPDGSIATASAAHSDPHIQVGSGKADARLRRDPSLLAAIAQVIRSGMPVVHRPFSVHVRKTFADAPTPHDATTALTFAAGAIVPLLVQGRAIGALSLGSMYAERAYPAGDSEFLSEIAARIALTLDNQRLRRQAQDAAEARDATLAIVAHELRTPLAALITQVQLLRRRIRDIELHDERMLQGLTTLDHQSRRLNLLVDTLFDATQFTRQPRPFAHERFDLVNTMQRVHDSFIGALVSHTLRLDLCAEPVIIDGDALRIEQALQNLLHNAVKYSPQGGAIELRLERSGAHARISISDEGIGIPPDDRDRIFERFYRAANAVSHGINGVGIGLYIVHAIIALHNGTIRVTDSPGAGAAFIVELPLAGAEELLPLQAS